MDDKDFPEDNAPKKQRAKTLGNLKNSTLTSTKEKSSEKKFLEKKHKEPKRKRINLKLRNQKKAKKNFLIAKKGDNITKDKTIQRKETDYYLKEIEEIRFPEVRGDNDFTLDKYSGLEKVSGEWSCGEQGFEGSFEAGRRHTFTAGVRLNGRDFAGMAPACYINGNMGVR